MGAERLQFFGDQGGGENPLGLLTIQSWTVGLGRPYFTPCLYEEYHESGEKSVEEEQEGKATRPRAMHLDRVSMPEEDWKCEGTRRQSYGKPTVDRCQFA